jgi:hypothetical protein
MPAISFSSKSKATTVYLLCALMVVTLVMTYIFTRTGPVSAELFILGVIGISVAVISLLYPMFGFYSSLVLSFFVFDISRYLNTDLPLASLTDLLVVLTFFGIIINKVLKGEPFLLHFSGPVITFYIIFALYNFLELLNPNGTSVTLGLVHLRRFVVLLIFFYCTIQLFKDMTTMRQFLRVWILLCILAGVYACYEEWFGMPAFEMNYIQANPLVEQLMSLDNGDYRKSSFISDCTAFGLMMSCTASIVLVLLLNYKSTISKPIIKSPIVLGVGMLIMLLGMSYSGTRTATFMLCINIALYVLFTLSDKKTLLFSVVFAMFFVFIIFGPIYGNATITRLRTTFQFSKDESFNVRDVNRHRIQPYIYKHPIGGGMGTTGVLNEGQNGGHPLAGFPTDSGFLRLVLEYGWVGMILQAIVYLVILWQGIRLYFKCRDPNARILVLVSTIGLFGYIISEYSQIAIGQIPSVFLYFALTAIIVRIRQINSEPHLEPKHEL